MKAPVLLVPPAQFAVSPAKILVRSTNWIGDAVMSSPALHTIRLNFPESEITVLAHPWVSDIFRYSPRVDRLLIYEKKGRHRGVQGMMQLVRELRAEQFDCAILLQNAFEAALITWWAKIPTRGGYDTDCRGFLLTHRIRRQPDLIKKHEIFYYQRILRGLGLQLGPSTPELFIPGDQLRAARELLQGLAEAQGIQAKGSGPLVGFNPGAAFGPAKRWPAEKFAELATALHRRTGARILLFGGPADQETAAQILSGASSEARQQIIDLSGKTTLIEAMALIGECDAFVTNDSGLMHVAAALHTPLAAIFGSTDHVATGPYADNATVICKNLPCAPCKKPFCPEKHFRCMKLIQVNEVLQATLNHLETP